MFIYSFFISEISKYLFVQKTIIRNQKQHFLIIKYKKNCKEKFHSDEYESLNSRMNSGSNRASAIHFTIPRSLCTP